MPRVQERKESRVTVSLSKTMYEKLDELRKRLGHTNMAETVRYVISRYFEVVEDD